MNHHCLGTHSNFYSIYLNVFIFNLHVKSCEQCKFNENALWQKDMDLGFCVKRCSLSLFWCWKPLSILSYCHAQEHIWWGGFLLMITMLLRSEKLGIIVMFFVLFYVWSRMVWAMELDNGTRLQETLGIPNKGFSLLFCL